jgi:hypothetical protein
MRVEALEQRRVIVARHRPVAPGAREMTQAFKRAGRKRRDVEWAPGILLVDEASVPQLVESRSRESSPAARSRSVCKQRGARREFSLYVALF